MDDISQLFRSFEIIPNDKNTLADNLNALTRLAIIASIVIAYYKPVVGFSVFFLSVIVILGFYYSKMSKDNYTELDFFNQYRFCNDDRVIDFNNEYIISPNQLLVGKANPKTYIPPILAAPSHDLDSWKETDLVSHSAINSRTNFDVSGSGYNFGILPTKCKDCCYVPCMCDKCPECGHKPCNCVRENFTEDKSRRRRRRRSAGRRRRDRPVSPPQTPPVIQQYNEREEYEMPPVEYESPRMDQLLTQTLQPGVYQKSHVAEPIQSNIGISYTQQFVPTEVEDLGDRIKYTQMDPNQIIQLPKLVEETIEQDVSNIYDPRFTGYGTGYRAYVDEQLGQPKFFYDDIDAIKMPNYITRSKVDIFPWAATYGPDVVKETTDHRQLANNAFVDSTITFRTEMQERLMRKRNAELWQRRVAPMRTF